MPSKVKVQAKDVASAIAQGLKDLGLRRDQVEVTVLEHPKKGFLGFGAKPALVEIRQKRWNSGDLDAQIYMDVPRKKRGNARGGGRSGSKRGGHDRDAFAARSERAERPEGNRRRGRKFDRVPRAEARDKAPKANEPQLLPCERIQNAVIPENLKAPMQEAKQYLNDMLSLMGVKTENLNVWWDEQQQRVLLTFDCDHPAIVIGKEGKTLEAVQYLCTLALSRHFDKPISVIADTQNYWRKAEDKINAEIERGVAIIEAGNSVFRFRPMSAQLRRYIHRALEGSPVVGTSSEGEGKWRKVTLRPKAKDAASAAPVAAALAEDAKEREMNEYSASSSCCAGEEEAEASCACGCDCQDAYAEQAVFSQTPARAEQPVTSEPRERDVCSCGCQSQHGEGTCSCGCETPAEAAPAQAETPAPAQTAQTPDDAQGGTCTPGIARNCAEGETQVGCACVAEFEAPAQTELSVPASAEPAKDDAEGATCTPEIARNCGDGEAETGCACGPLFETAAEADKQDAR